jgi:NAD(P)-dependent dehydrogenase (short-subunit alcohol dehydrogenase family)
MLAAFMQVIRYYRPRGQARVIASAVLWLCSPSATYVVGHALTVDDRMTVL